MDSPQLTWNAGSWFHCIPKRCKMFLVPVSQTKGDKQKYSPGGQMFQKQTNKQKKGVNLLFCVSEDLSTELIFKSKCVWFRRIQLKKPVLKQSRLIHLLVLTNKLPNPRGFKTSGQIDRVWNLNKPQTQRFIGEWIWAHLHLISKWRQTKLTSSSQDWSVKNILSFQLSSRFPDKTR